MINIIRYVIIPRWGKTGEVSPVFPRFFFPTVISKQIIINLRNLIITFVIPRWGKTGEVSPVFPQFFSHIQCNMYFHFRCHIRPILFGIADITPPRLVKCNTDLVSLIKDHGLFVPYIVHIFDSVKSRTMV